RSSLGRGFAASLDTARRPLSARHSCPNCETCQASVCVPPGQEGRICASKKISRSFLSGADRAVGQIPQNSLEIDPPPPRSIRRLRNIFLRSLAPLLARRGQSPCPETRPKI